MVNSSDPRTPTRTYSNGRVTGIIILILVMFVVAGCVYWLMSGAGDTDSTVFVDNPPAAGGPPAPANPPAADPGLPVNPNPEPPPAAN